MSKFKSFASQGSFGDYRVEVPDESGKILQQKADVIRGRERAEQFRQENSALFLRAQQFAQGLEAEQREQNFQRETANRQAFKDQLNEEHNLQVKADEQRLEVQQRNLKNIVEFTTTGAKLYGQYQQNKTINQTKKNTVLTYKAGADYKTLVAISAIKDNLTKAEFGQLDFIRKKVEEGGNIDDFYALFQRRKTRGFIDNIATAQNTAHGFETAQGLYLENYVKENQNVTTEQLEIAKKAFRDSYITENFTFDGRTLNADLLNEVAFPIIRAAENRSNAERERQRTKEIENIRFDGQTKAFNVALGDRDFINLMKSVTTDPSSGKFADFAKYVINKSKDFGPTGFTSTDIDTILDTVYEGVNFADTGKYSTLRVDREGRPEVLLLLAAREERRKAEHTNHNLDVKEAGIRMDAELSTMYEGFVQDGRFTDDEIAQMEAKAAELPGHTSAILESARKQTDSFRDNESYVELAKKQYAEGKTVFDPQTVKGLSAEGRQTVENLRSRQFKLEGSDTSHASDISYIKDQVLQDPRIVNKKGSTVSLMQTKLVQKYKTLLRQTENHEQARAAAVALLKTEAITADGHYASMLKDEQGKTVDAKRVLRSYDDALKAARTNQGYRAVRDALGAQIIDKAYSTMKAGLPVPPIIRTLASIYGQSPLDFMNNLIGDENRKAYPMLTLDAQAEQLRVNLKPLAARLVNTYPGDASIIARAEATSNINGRSVSSSPTRFSFGPSQTSTLQNPILRRAADITSNYESAGAGGYNAVNQGGEAGGTKIPAGFYSGDFRKMKQHKGRALTDLTVGEIMDLQADPGKSKMSDAEWVKRGKLHAVGRYQFIGSTLKGLVQRLGISRNEKFTPQLQDKLFLSLLKSGGAGQWVGLRNATAEELRIINQAQSML